MMSKLRIFKKILLYICCQFLFISVNAATWDSLTANLDISCQQPDKDRLDCDYRLLIPEPPLAIRADVNRKKLEITDHSIYPWAGGISAFLFVVDTSDPARQDAVDKKINHIEQILKNSRPHHRIGLASFDKDLRIEAPIGSSSAKIISAAKGLRALGKTTELYRDLLKAISILAGIEADRKAILLFSDGQAEDRAYFHQDIIKSARKNGVIINSLGYPRSVALSVALQTLRRLSEETGGVYVEADNNFNLPATTLDYQFENIDRGGRFSVNLAPLTISNNTNIRLTMETDIGDIITQIPVKMPAKPPAQKHQTTLAQPVNQLPQATTIKLLAPATERQGIDKWLWYGLPAVLIILLILMVITLIVAFQQKSIKSQVSSSSAVEYKPFAYLVVQDEKATRYPITNTTWRIGRTKDNELTLQDSSISRRHAEIHRYSNGNFIIFDVDSLNGVYVNEEKIKKKRLQEGDIIEIGDINLRFTLYSSDYQSDEDTAVQHTKAPVA